LSLRTSGARLIVCLIQALRNLMVACTWLPSSRASGAHHRRIKRSKKEGEPIMVRLPL
jgi:hypothetical protein